MEYGHNYLLRMLVIITDKPVEKKVSKILDEYHVPVRLQFLGKGTAKSEFLQICGLSESGRTITACFLQREKVGRIFRSLEEHLKIKEKGKGIAFSISVNGLQGYLLKKLGEGQEAMEDKPERNEQSMKEENSYVLILVACSHGYSGEVMEAARSAGATGGTIMKSRRQGAEEPAKFLGVSIQEEQEVVSIVVPKDIKKEVMKAVNEKCGCQTMAKGIILSLPVDEIIGLF